MTSESTSGGGFNATECRASEMMSVGHNLTEGRSYHIRKPLVALAPVKLTYINQIPSLNHMWDLEKFGPSRSSPLLSLKVKRAVKALGHNWRRRASADVVGTLGQ